MSFICLLYGLREPYHMARKHEATHLVVVIKYILDLYKCTVLKAIVYKGVIFPFVSFFLNIIFLQKLRPLALSSWKSVVVTKIGILLLNKENQYEIVSLTSLGI